MSMFYKWLVVVMFVTLVAVTATSDQNQGDHAFGKEKTKTPIAQVFLQIEPFLK